MEMSRLGALFGLPQPALRLDGKLVHLRPPERADWAEWAELRAASRDFLKPWEPSWSPDALTRAGFRRRLARHAADWRDGEGYNFFIRNDDRRLVGGIGLSHVRRGIAESGNVGYWTGQPFANQGYMTDALAVMLRFAFEDQRLHRLEAACLPSNGPSRRVLERAGFRHEGYAREYLCIDGIWQDHLLFALLAKDPRPGAR